MMTSRRRSSSRARLKLRRCLSEQLRSSTSKAWDFLWRNVRERRVAGQCPRRRSTVAPLQGRTVDGSLSTTTRREN
ncbi:hypothetical protein JOB18_031671 [Solea senegalensis]|uniref:Uncharacterized protein n=1 Tax=Solea senegalensis TaxID=28829 RepID=A0AAV6PYE9_SOLSE|nr:hypothetical protein JOB18_031671 [Solea senegalensis]